MCLIIFILYLVFNYIHTDHTHTTFVTHHMENCYSPCGKPRLMNELFVWHEAEDGCGIR